MQEVNPLEILEATTGKNRVAEPELTIILDHSLKSYEKTYYYYHIIIVSLPTYLLFFS